MFQQLKNLDTAFKHVRLFSLFFLIASTLLSGFVVYRITTALQKGQQKVFILSNGKLLEAQGIDRVEALSVEIRDHVKMFHYYFYSLEPDDQANEKHLSKALYLADNTAKDERDNLTERGYYSNIISSNTSQEVPDYDSIHISLNQAPYYFKYYGKLRLVRETTIVTRSLITEGYIRVLPTVSDNNPHGFLIENWKVLENKDITIEKREHENNF